MEYEEMRKWLITNKFTAYELSKNIDLSMQGLQDFLNGGRTPQRKTLLKIEEFISQISANNHQYHDKNSYVAETQEKYTTDISNKDLLLAFNAIGESLLANSIAVSKLMIETHENVSHLLSHATQKHIKEIYEVVRKINQKLETKRT